MNIWNNLASSGDERRFEREKSFWKCLAIAQCFIILLIAFNAKNFIHTTIFQSGRQTPVPVPLVPVPAVNLSQVTERVDVDIPQNSKYQFSSQDLEMFQSQTNSSLVKDLRDNWLRPPSELPYNVTPDTNADLSGVKRLHKIVLEQFGGMRNGFFIECGAFDGVRLSNTLHLEQEFNWTGLLVEADPEYYQRLATRQRKTWTINACLSIKPYEEKVRMTRIKTEEALSIISEFADHKFRQRPEAEAEEFQVQCFPLTSILAALGQTLNIDYFSLDVEGAELKILQTIPWNFVYIKVISLESNDERIAPLVKFLGSKNYEFLRHVNGPWINDHVFIHRQFMHDRQFAYTSKGAGAQAPNGK